MPDAHTNFFMHETKHLPMWFYTASQAHVQEHVKATSHEWYHILFIVKGRGTVKCMGKTYKLKTGSGFFVQPYTPIEYYGTDGFTSAYITAFGPAFPGLLDYMKCDKFVFFESVNTDRFLSKIKQITKEYDTYRRGEIMSSLTFSLFAEFLGQNNLASIDEIDTVAHYIENNYVNKLTLDELAKVAHISVSKLCHGFKQKYNSTVFEYILHIRLEEAKRHLQALPDLPIKDVATSCGFNDVSYFCRSYKAKYNVTPSQDREKLH